MIEMFLNIDKMKNIQNILAAKSSSEKVHPQRKDESKVKEINLKK